MVSVDDLSALFWPTDAVLTVLRVAVSVSLSSVQAPGYVRVGSQNASRQTYDVSVHLVSG